MISVGLINLIPETDRDSTLKRIQSITNINGLNAVSAFVDKPFLDTKNESDMKSGELLGSYHPWRIHWITQSLFKSDEKVFCVDRVIAEKIDKSKITPELVKQSLQLI